MNRRSFLTRLLGTPIVGRALLKLQRTPTVLAKPEVVGSFDKWIFPVIRSSMPPTLIGDLVNIQPMNEPSATALYLDFKASK